MSDMTRVTAFKTLDAVAGNASYWKHAGYHVAVVGPTDAVRLANGVDDTDIWESGEESDWYLVIASKASLEIIAAKPS